MDSEAMQMKLADKMVNIFENVLLTEEIALQKGYFSDLSIAELHALDAIGPYEARTMSETASILGITVGSLTVAIDRLVKKGYVQRNRDTKDRRIVRISLTREGKLAHRLHAKFHYVLARRILEPYTEEQQAQLLKVAEEIDEYIEQSLQRYNSKESVRKTAKAVARESRRRKDNG